MALSWTVTVAGLALYCGGHETTSQQTMQGTHLRKILLELCPDHQKICDMHQFEMVYLSLCIETFWRYASCNSLASRRDQHRLVRLDCGRLRSGRRNDKKIKPASASEKQTERWRGANLTEDSVPNSHQSSKESSDVPHPKQQCSLFQPSEPLRLEVEASPTRFCGPRMGHAGSYGKNILEVMLDSVGFPPCFFTRNGNLVENVMLKNKNQENSTVSLQIRISTRTFGCIHTDGHTTPRKMSSGQGAGAYQFVDRKHQQFPYKLLALLRDRTLLKIPGLCSLVPDVCSPCRGGNRWSKPRTT